MPAMHRYALGRFGAFGLRHLRRKLGRTLPSLRDHAGPARELCPAESGSIPAPLMLPGHLDRVTGTHPGRSLRSVLEHATMTAAHHEATTVRCVTDVVLHRGYLFHGSVAQHLSGRRLPSWTGAIPERAEEHMLTSSSAGSTFFGDWLLGDGLLDDLARESGMPPLKVAPSPPYPHAPDIARITGLHDELAEACRVPALHLVHDAGYNASKRERLHRLRARVRDATVGRPPSDQPVFLARGAGRPGRALGDESALVDHLVGRGFRIVDPSRSTVMEILDACMDCPVVVGVEGSQMAWGFLCLADGGAMITLQPPYGFQSAFRPRCVGAGLQWGFLVGQPCDEGFTVDPSELDRLLDLTSR